MNKLEASKFLNVTTRSLERYVKEGLIGATYERGKTRPVVAFDRGELERFKADLESKVYKPAIESNGSNNDESALAQLRKTTPQQAELAVAEQLIEAIKALLSHQKRQPIEHKLLLTLPEVQALTGLSYKRLSQAIRERRLKARKLGKSWRIKRVDLDEFIDKL